MVFFGGLLGLLALGVWIFCILDVFTTPRDQVRLLPKIAWIAVVILFVDLGSIAWLLAGRPWTARATTPDRSGGGTSGGFGSAGSAATSVRRAPRRATNPDDDDEFLAGLSKRAEDERRNRENGTDGPAPTA